LLKEKGETIPDANLLIAATAIANNLAITTKDRHFKRLESYGLKVELRS
jgi:predicted nucleic acid-binding protein